MTSEEHDPRIVVDEDWTSRVEAEKEELRRKELESRAASGPDAPESIPGTDSSASETSSRVNASSESAGSEGLQANATDFGTERSSRPEQTSDGQGASKEGARSSGDVPPRLPPATFGSLIETLSMQAMASLSEASQPADSKDKAEGLPDPRFHIEMAKYLIDTLSVLEEKTQGNLSDQEAKQLEVVLHDLRIAFVMIRKQHA